MSGDDDGFSACGQARRKRRSSTREPVAVWTEKENIGGKIVPAGVVILRTSGCAHAASGGCTMCGYNVESESGTSADDISAQFVAATNDMRDIELLKVYTSGSFLDAREMPAENARMILDWCRDRGVSILVESRAEFVTDESIGQTMAIHDDIELAIGLESANDKVLKYSINKNMTVADFDHAAAIVRKAGAKLRSYILLKPPYLTEAEAIEDTILTAKHAALMSDTISVNPVNVQKGTIVERLWKTWSYRPPWLWSVIEVLNACVELDRKVVCDPTGGGRERGAHNCSRCDDEALAAIREYSVGQLRKKIPISECECREIWETVRELEGFVVGGTPDLQRLYRERQSHR